MIAQGVEAGGHVRGSVPALDLLARVRAAVAPGYPVLSAGAVADRRDVRARLDAGAAAVVCGTRFLMTEESCAHPGYKERLLDARDTVLTELFGAGWPAPHRVVAMRRPSAGSPRTPAAPAGCARFIAPPLPPSRVSRCRSNSAWPPGSGRAGPCSGPPPPPPGDRRT